MKLIKDGEIVKEVDVHGGFLGIAADSISLDYLDLRALSISPTELQLDFLSRAFMRLLPDSEAQKNED